MSKAIKYYVNHRVSDGAVFIAKSRIMRKECICLGTLLGIPAPECKLTGGLNVGDVGETIKGERIQIVEANPYV